MKLDRWQKRLLRAPIVLYRLRLDRLLGHRFLLLTHRGRLSGRHYRTMLEVVRWNAVEREAIVVSGFGKASNWRLNVLAGGALEVRIGGARFRPELREVGAEEAIAVLAEYERRYRLLRPLVQAILARLSGMPYDGSEPSRRQAAEALPMLAFRRSA